MKNGLYYFTTIIVLISCRYREIMQHQGVTIAQITSIGGVIIEEVVNFWFILIKKDSIYSDEYPVAIRSKFVDRYIGKSFPMVYSTIDPEKSILLIFPEDFETWNLQFPDSLNWVKESW